MADRFSDAAGAIQSYTRKELKVPEVSVVRAESRPVVAGEPLPRGFRVIDVVAAGRQAPEPATKPGIALDYRNIGQVDVKVYPVDLMQLYLTRRNLNGIAGIDLAGITPLVEKTVALGDGADYDDKSKSIDLPLAKEGAYLTMIRGDNLYASGIVLVTPLEMEVLEEPASGRVRVTVRDARTKEFLPKVQVKVIGSATPQFISGETDLRGVFVAEGLRGSVTAVARNGNIAVRLLPRDQLPGQPRPQRQRRPGEARPRKARLRLRKNNRSTPTSRCRIPPIRSGRSSGSSSATLSRPTRARARPPAVSVKCLDDPGRASLLASRVLVTVARWARPPGIMQRRLTG